MKQEKQDSNFFSGGSVSEICFLVRSPNPISKIMIFMLLKISLMFPRRFIIRRYKCHQKLIAVVQVIVEVRRAASAAAVEVQVHMLVGVHLGQVLTADHPQVHRADHHFPEVSAHEAVGLLVIAPHHSVRHRAVITSNRLDIRLTLIIRCHRCVRVIISRAMDLQPCLPQCSSRA